MGPPAAAVEEAVKAEAPDWDDDGAWAARFRAFSGQRADWTPVTSSGVNNVWFARRGLTPLCMNRVLIEMHKEGDIFLRRDLTDPARGQIFQLLRRIGQLIVLSKSSALEENTDECLVLRGLLQDKTVDVIKSLSESHWTSSCVVTMCKLESICGGSDEASIISSYLVQCGKAQYLSIKKTDFVEGLKVSLVPSSVPSLTSLDYEILHLIWTMEKMQQQVDMIDQRWELSRKSALASFKSGNRPAAYGHIRRTKLLASSREKCASLLDRVEEVLGIMNQAESTKKASEAIQLGAQAIKKQQISVEQVHLCLQELSETVASQKQVDEALGLALLESTDVEDEYLEEFKRLESELTEEAPQMTKSEVIVGDNAQMRTPRSRKQPARLLIHFHTSTSRPLSSCEVQ
ncbi:unnamed protein product [Spirodela intermedia]|uniref:Uncharacterized protein n=1 Tax=Spirodela intermedia TaxID=51605 RepID=A0A7I8JGH8_SPIIN|nr:unnamed protein product [Spirodela intermedia]CAA6668865.1 unnamed protein product [Spirodela intermedia]